MKTCTLVGIGGPSGSGKSTLAHALQSHLEAATVISVDSYYHPLDHLPLGERHKCNFDHPDSIDWDLFAEQLESLTRSREILQPVYSFHEHTRMPGAVPIMPHGVVIIEGILTLHHPAIRPLLDLKIYVEAPDDLCYGRRRERDLVERGRSEQSVAEQYTSTVRPMAEQFVWPTRAHADIVVRGTDPLPQSVQLIATALTGSLVAE